MSAGCEGTGFACCTGFEQLTMTPASRTATLKTNDETDLGFHPAHFMTASSKVLQSKENTTVRNYTKYASAEQAREASPGDSYRVQDAGKRRCVQRIEPDREVPKPAARVSEFPPANAPALHALEWALHPLRWPPMPQRGSPLHSSDPGRRHGGTHAPVRQ